MPAAKKTIYMDKGASFSESYQVLDAGVPRNITGAVITFKAKEAGASVPLSLDLAVGTGITITDAANGKFSVVVASVGLSAAKKYDYTLKIALGGVTQRLAEGDIQVSDEVA